MEEAKIGQGIDRHLFGLAVAARENGIKVSEQELYRNVLHFRIYTIANSYYCTCRDIETLFSQVPALFSDPSFSLSGGGGNFVLSTSTSGYSGMSGGAAAMTRDGYGAFYNFESEQG